MTDIEKLARWMGWNCPDLQPGLFMSDETLMLVPEPRRISTSATDWRAWHPTTDDADALMLVDRAIELGWGVSINSVDPELWQGNLWECIFQASGVSVDESWLYEHADTRPAAISAAVLRVIKEG